MLNVNINPKYFMREYISDTLAALGARTKVDPNLLCQSVYPVSDDNPDQI